MNVVFVGECGTGKSSLINLIVGQDVAKSSNAAAACTTDIRAYKTSIDGCNVKLWDTPGFNEGLPARPPANTRSLEVVVQSLHDLATKGDIHLLVYCINGNRAKAALLKHYNTIRAFLPHRVRMVAVITRLERYQNRMEDWWSANGQDLADLGVDFADHVCITTIPDAHGLHPSFRERRLHSIKAIRELILRNCPSQIPLVSFPKIPISDMVIPEQKVRIVPYTPRGYRGAQSWMPIARIPKMLSYEA